jgi:hypothetical protein
MARKKSTRGAVSDQHQSERFKSRIKEHRKVKASLLTPHPLNPRTHGEGQRSALRALLDEVGLARSLLAYEDEEWGLTLIDGHLRQEELDDQVVEVEVLDVTREEAEKLLISMDPLAALAGFDTERLDILRTRVATDNDALKTLWANVDRASREVEQILDEKKKKDRNPAEGEREVDQSLPEKWLVIIECDDESHQRDMLRFVKDHGVKARAVIT